MKNTADQSSSSHLEKQSFLAEGMVVVLFLGLANFLFHCYFNNRYGYFRDEFDYMACGDHLAWGYVDQPPLVRVYRSTSKTRVDWTAVPSEKFASRQFQGDIENEKREAGQVFPPPFLFPSRGVQLA